MTTNFTDTEITSYLLGELTEDARALLAEACADDPAFFTRVAEIEDDLIDDYARGRLDETLRRRFDQHYLTNPARRRRVQLAQVLLPKLDQAAEKTSAPAFDQNTLPREPSLSFWQRLFPRFPVPALATILLLALGGGLLYQIAQLRNELNEQRAARVRAEQQLNELQQRNERLSAEIAQRQTAPDVAPPKSLPNDPASVATLSLPAGQLMSSTPGSTTPTLILPSGAKQARLQFNLTPGDYSRYRAVLQTADGTTIHQQPNLQPRRRPTTAVFTILVSADQLASGEYILTLSGINSAGETDTLAKSLFRVQKK